MGSMPPPHASRPGSQNDDDQGAGAELDQLAATIKEVRAGCLKRALEEVVPVLVEVEVAVPRLTPAIW